MKNNKETRNIIIFIAIILVFTGAYIIIDKYLNNDVEQKEFLKNYEVNEYIPTYVSDEEMARIYLNEYIYIMYSDTERAYQLLDEKYRKEKFGDIENFKNYIKTLNYSTYKVNKFYVDEKGGYKIYGVYDTNGNLFIFKTNGVMQYTVYLDDYTVEI